MQVRWGKSAMKVLRRVQPDLAKRIRAAVLEFAADPFRPDHNRRPLEGVVRGFRLRIGDWRVSLTLDAEAGVIEVFEVAPRGGAYRW